MGELNTIFPVPFALRSKFEFDFVTLITLSVKLKLESIVKFETLTTPVPPGESNKLAFELVAIILSLIAVSYTHLTLPTNREV